MIDTFYAVTQTSVYEVGTEPDGRAFAKKIALSGSSNFPVGRKLKGADMIAICKNLVAFTPERYGMTSPLTAVERRIEMVNTRWWGEQTSLIAALFKDKADALLCFRKADRVACDLRWAPFTKEVLAAIGDNHPCFSICRSPGLALFPCEVGAPA